MAENENQKFDGYIVPKIEIENGRIFIEGKETVDPTLIGYAILDFAEDNHKKVVDIKSIFLLNKSKFFEKYKQYIKESNLNLTFERKLLIDLICDMPNNFNSSDDFVKKAMALNISYPTCYNFLKHICKSGLIKLNSKTYSFSESLTTER